MTWNGFVLIVRATMPSLGHLGPITAVLEVPGAQTWQGGSYYQYKPIPGHSVPFPAFSRKCSFLFILFILSTGSQEGFFVFRRSFYLFLPQCTTGGLSHTFIHPKISICQTYPACVQKLGFIVPTFYTSYNFRFRNPRRHKLCRVTLSVNTVIL